MNIRNLLIATTLFTAVSASAYAEKVIINGPAYQAATGLVNNTTQARYALAVNDVAGAKKHIESAKAAGKKLAEFSADKQRVTGIKSGRISYDTKLEEQKDGAHYYYPVETGTITQKDIKAGPFWASNKGLGITDAELVYVTVDISGVEVQKDLDEAFAEINKNDLDDADDDLEDILEDIVAVEDRQQALALQAKDNLQLARDYLAAKNYDAARFPLKHAKSSLKSMEGNKRYATEQALVQKYLKEVERSEKIVAKKDPSAIEKLQAEWKAGWNEFKNWADKEFN